MTSVATFIVRQALPQRRVGAGVAGEDPGRPRRRRLRSTAKPTAGTVCAARQHLDAPCRRASSTLAHRDRHEAAAPGARRSGRRVKSGQITPLKMCVRSASSVAGSACTRDRRAAARRAAAHHAVGQQADGQHVVQVRVADEDVVDARQLVERQVADAGAGVDRARRRRAGRTVVRLPAAIEPEQPRTRICMRSRRR